MSLDLFDGLAMFFSGVMLGCSIYRMSTMRKHWKEIDQLHDKHLAEVAGLRARIVSMTADHADHLRMIQEGIEKAKRPGGSLYGKR